LLLYYFRPDVAVQNRSMMADSVTVILNLIPR
jgi:hypothetical protein